MSTSYPIRPPPDFIYDPPKAEPKILHLDDDILIVEKPSGLLSVSGRLEIHADCLEARVQAIYPDAKIVHRLDMSTSGLMVMAMNAVAHRILGLQFEKRKTRKVYIATVWGRISEASGCVDLPLLCDWPNRPIQRVDLTRGKNAQTDWEVLSNDKTDKGDDLTRVALYPVTGRTHQLRVHMAEIGHPIIGDDFYAHKNAFFAADRLHLHAHKLMIHHPNGGAKTWFESPVPF